MRTPIILGFVLVGLILLGAATFAILNEVHRIFDPWLAQISEVLEMMNPDQPTTVPTPTTTRVR